MFVKGAHKNRKSRSLFLPLESLRIVQVSSPRPFLILRLLVGDPTRGLMAGAALDDETISNMSGDTFLLSSGEDEVSLTAQLQRERTSSSNALPEQLPASRPVSYAAAAATAPNTNNNVNPVDRPRY